MKYRAVYQEDETGFKVVTAYENDSNVITTTGQKFMVDDLEDLMWKLSSNGVDISYFWKEGLSSRIIPFREEIDISNCPLDDSVTRTAFVHETNTRYSSKETHFNVVVRHFKEGVYCNPLIDPSFTYDDIMINRILDNTTKVDVDGEDIGEWDYLFHLVDTAAYTQPFLENRRIVLLDERGSFGVEIY